jgi:hypothetical protein
MPAINSGCREGGVDFGMARVDSAFRAIVAESQHAVLQGAHTVETPLSVDDSLSALALGEGFGGEIDEEFFGEALVGGEVFGGQDYDARGEAVAQSVQAGSFLADLGARARTLLGIAAIGFFRKYFSAPLFAMSCGSDYWRLLVELPLLGVAGAAEGRTRRPSLPSRRT